MHILFNFQNSQNRPVSTVTAERLGYVRNLRSLMEGTETLCRDDIGGFTWKPRSSLTKEKMPMKLARGFCIPEPLPVHTGIKGATGASTD